MKYLFLIPIFLIAIALMLFGLAARPAIDAAVIVQAQPDSVADTIMRSRETPPVAPEGGRSWAVAAVLGLGTVAVIAALVGMRYGSELLRQWRLARRGGHNQRPYTSHPALPVPQPPAYQLPAPPEPDYRRLGDGYHE